MHCATQRNTKSTQASHKKLCCYTSERHYCGTMCTLSLNTTFFCIIYTIVSVIDTHISSHTFFYIRLPTFTVDRVSPTVERFFATAPILVVLALNGLFDSDILPAVDGRRWDVVAADVGRILSGVADVTGCNIKLLGANLKIIIF